VNVGNVSVGVAATPESEPGPATFFLSPCRWLHSTSQYVRLTPPPGSHVTIIVPPAGLATLSLCDQDVAVDAACGTPLWAYSYTHQTTRASRRVPADRLPLLGCLRLGIPRLRSSWLQAFRGPPRVADTSIVLHHFHGRILKLTLHSLVPAQAFHHSSFRLSLMSHHVFQF
jgi:hypothetical protein